MLCIGGFLCLLNSEGDVKTKCSVMKLKHFSSETHKTFIQNSIKILPLLSYGAYLSFFFFNFFVNG